MLPTYTFIIPHYNIPTLLLRCIDTIPMRDDIEIIVVDDASDNPPVNLRQDVKLISLSEHRGTGFARNVGLAAAHGKWILFPDSDDFYNPGMIDVLDRYADTDNQLLFFSVDSRDSDTLEINERRSRILKRQVSAAADGDRKALDELLYCCSSVCFKMFSKQFIDEWQMKFEEIPKNNDVFFSLNSNFHTKRYAIVPEQLYCITYRPGSVSYSQRTWESYLAIISSSIKKNKYYEALGRKDFVSPFYKLFLGFDNPLRRKNLAEELCNCMVYAIKVFLVLVSHFRMLYRTRNAYIDAILKTEK